MGRTQIVKSIYSKISVNYLCIALLVVGGQFVSLSHCESKF